MPAEQYTKLFFFTATLTTPKPSVTVRFESAEKPGLFTL